MIIHFGRNNIYLRKLNNSIYIFIYYRILVPSDSVGAIIGKQGSTVKQIKQTAHAK